MLVKIETVVNIPDDADLIAANISKEIKNTVSHFTEATLIAQRQTQTSFYYEDLQAFANASLVVHIHNAEEYATFMDYLSECGYYISNSADFRARTGDYDPFYQYYFIEDVKDRYMNANHTFENIQDQLSNSLILKNFCDLDFVKDKNNLYQQAKEEQENELE